LDAKTNGITNKEGEMKHIIGFMIMAFTAQGAWADFMDSGEEFASAPSGVYLPRGFDTNDNVEIFFEGEFSDTCHKVGMTTHHIDEETKSIYITDLGHYYGSAFCAMMLVPYQKGINAGNLPKGDWKIYFRHSRGNFVESGELPVRTAKTDRPDDHLYAPVEKTIYMGSEGDQPPRLKLMGKFFSTCMRMDYIDVRQDSESNVVDILPVAIMDRGGCEDVPEGIEFNHIVKLKDLRPGRFLLHTRANNGRSVNEIVTIR
jgi:hypothetical protein